MDVFVPHRLHETDRPVRRAVRQIRWFKRSFKDEVEIVGKSTGIGFAINNDRLARAYVGWVRAFEAQKPDDPGMRRSYTKFASGLMLRELILADPLTAHTVPEGDGDHPAFYWAEGYVYVGYCLNVRAAVLAQDFGEPLVLSKHLSDMRTWWSLRENVREDPSVAVAFLDFVSGEVPAWDAQARFIATDRDQAKLLARA